MSQVVRKSWGGRHFIFIYFFIQHTIEFTQQHIITAVGRYSVPRNWHVSDSLLPELRRPGVKELADRPLNTFSFGDFFSAWNALRKRNKV